MPLTQSRKIMRSFLCNGNTVLGTGIDSAEEDDVVVNAVVLEREGINKF